MLEAPAELARRLRDGLNAMDSRGPRDISPDDAARLAELATQLSATLGELSPAARLLVHTADSGFAVTGKWVDDAMAAQDQAVEHIARGAQVMVGWLGPDGLEAERTFLMRGNIRAWAHRWRTEDKGPAQVDSDAEFLAFATDCLKQAGIQGDYRELIGKALSKDWRTAK